MKRIFLFVLTANNGESLPLGFISFVFMVLIYLIGSLVIAFLFYLFKRRRRKARTIIISNTNSCMKYLEKGMKDLEKVRTIVARFLNFRTR